MSSLVCFAATANASVLDDVDIRPSPEGRTVHVTFNTVLRYRSHTPKSTGNIVVIYLTPVLDDAGTPIKIDERRTFPISPDNPVSEVRYQGDLPTDPLLVLSFVRPVIFRIVPGADSKSIDIIIEQPAASVPATPSGTKRVPQAVAPAQRRRTETAYVLNLESRPSPFSAAELSDVTEFREYELYDAPFRKDGETWHCLRLGFFGSKEEALEIRKTLPPRFAEAWIATATAKEQEEAAANAIVLRGPAATPSRPAGSAGKAAPSAPLPDAATAPAIPDNRLEQIWEEARTAMVDGNYNSAVRLYSKLLTLPPHRYTQQAQEFLGLARERKGQFAHAKAEYERYLELYPEGEGADRVRQRLAGVLTAGKAPRDKLRTAATAPDQAAWETEYYGSLAQYYTYRATVRDTTGRETTQSDLITDFDATVRARDDQQDYRMVVVGGHGLNFLDSADVNDSRIGALYLDGADRQAGISGRFGRQTKNSSGIFGRFDGGFVGYRLESNLKLNVAAGLPVDRTTDIKLNEHRYFYALSADMGPYRERWNFNLFAIEQRVDTVVDRRAVGGEARYLGDGVSFFSLLDYDVYFSSLNIALANATFRMEDDTSVNVAADFRNSPILTTTSALQGQGVESISQLRALFDDGQIQGLAEDRTAFSQSYTVGASRPLDTHFQVNGDVTASKLSDTEASGGVAANPGTSYEFYYSAQLTGAGIVSESDVTIFGLRYADTDRFDSVTADLNVRYAFDRQWRINPRIRTDYAFNNADDGGTRFRVRPSVRLSYRVEKWANLELESGGEWTTEKFIVDPVLVTQDRQSSTEWYVLGGYRADF